MNASAKTLPMGVDRARHLIVVDIHDDILEDFAPFELAGPSYERLCMADDAIIVDVDWRPGNKLQFWCVEEADLEACSERVVETLGALLTNYQFSTVYYD